MKEEKARRVQTPGLHSKPNSLDRETFDSQPERRISVEDDSLMILDESGLEQKIFLQHKTISPKRQRSEEEALSKSTPIELLAGRDIAAPDVESRADIASSADSEQVLEINAPKIRRPISSEKGEEGRPDTICDNAKHLERVGDSLAVNEREMAASHVESHTDIASAYGEQVLDINAPKIRRPISSEKGEEGRPDSIGDNAKHLEPVGDSLAVNGLEVTGHSNNSSQEVDASDDVITTSPAESKQVVTVAVIDSDSALSESRHVELLAGREVVVPDVESPTYTASADVEQVLDINAPKIRRPLGSEKDEQGRPDGIGENAKHFQRVEDSLVVEVTGHNSRHETELSDNVITTSPAESKQVVTVAVSDNDSALSESRHVELLVGRTVTVPDVESHT